jgi:hypothetical protein
MNPKPEATPLEFPAIVFFQRSHIAEVLIHPFFDAVPCNLWGESCQPTAPPQAWR